MTPYVNGTVITKYRDTLQTLLLRNGVFVFRNNDATSKYVGYLRIRSKNHRERPTRCCNPSCRLGVKLNPLRVKINQYEDKVKWQCSVNTVTKLRVT